MLAIQSQTFYMPSSGIHSQTFSFTNTVKDFGVAMQGFEVSYGQESHNVKEIVAGITNAYLSTDQTQVTVEASLFLNDNSSNSGQGLIDIVVFADLKT